MDDHFQSPHVASQRVNMSRIGDTFGDVEGRE